MEIDDRVTDAIDKFFYTFESRSVIGLILPDGWYGRPYDNYYEFVDAVADGGVVNVDLGKYQVGCGDCFLMT